MSHKNVRTPTYTFDPAFIGRSLKGLDESRRVAFGIFLLERALPAFFQFQIDTGCTGGGELRAALAQCWHALEHGSLPNDPFITVMTCESLMPDSEDYTSIYTSSAIDAVNIACSLLSYFERKELRLLMEAVESRIDTIDLFIQNSDFINDKDTERETAIISHPLMQEELCFMYDDIAFLSATNDQRTALFAMILKRISELGYRELRLGTGGARGAGAAQRVSPSRSTR